MEYLHLTWLLRAQNDQCTSDVEVLILFVWFCIPKNLVRFECFEFHGMIPGPNLSESAAKILVDFHLIDDKKLLYYLSFNIKKTLLN